jgi:hypothetical protein
MDAPYKITAKKNAELKEMMETAEIYSVAIFR